MQNNVLSDQDLFERVAVHLLRQGAKSTLPSDVGANEGNCAYRGENETMCAVGCLIKDKYYDEALEECSVSDPRVLGAVTESLGGSPYLALLNRLQEVHDCFPVEDWAKELKNCSTDFGLDYRPVEGYLATA